MSYRTYIDSNYPGAETAGARRWRPVLAILIGILFAGTKASAQEPSSSDIDRLLATPISGAAKYEQTVRQAPGDVTIVTSDEIRDYGYRTLAEVLGSVRGFSVTN